MKIAKKVLSVLLAIAMVLGTFAVAASANGNKDTASHQVKYWLTASPITGGATWTSNTKYTAAVWEDSQTGDMTVEAGQMVMIAVHLTTNYYAGMIQGMVYMDSRLLDAGEIFKNQRGTTATTAKTSKMLTWNTANEYVGYCVTANAICNPSSIMVDTGILQDFNFCTDDDGNVPFKEGGGTFASADEAKACGWKYVKYFIVPDYNGEETCILEDEEESLFYFPVQIPEDAQPGDTYKFTIPEENIRRSTNTKGGMYLSECPDGEATASNLNDTSLVYFDDDQYFDLSGTNITLTVAGGETTEIDYSALQAEYDSVKDTVVSNYNNTTDFTTALAAAKDMLDNKNAADQDAVSTALTNLQNGYKALQIKSADYTALEAAKNAAANISSDNYEQDSNWTAFQSAYSAANNIASGLDITHQTEITAAATALNNAIANLTPKTVEEDANYDALNAEIATSQNIVDNQSSSWYTESTWSAFTTALAAANAVPTGLKASSQSTIDTAKSNLETARNGLVEADADYTALNALVNECAAYSQDDYRAAEWGTFANALSAAQAVPTGLKAKNQSTIDTAYDNLLTAKNALVPLGGADYSELRAEVEKGVDYTQDYYTKSTWAAYQTVLASANEMLEAANLKENEQSKVTKMVEDLIAAKAALDIVAADYSAVENAIAGIPTTEDLVAYYTSDSAQAVVDAKNAVAYGLKKNQQGEVDAYAADILAKIDALVLLPADTTALKTAIDKAAAVNSDLYTSASYEAMKAELDNANTLYAKSDLTKKYDQATVDAQTSALNDAVTNLVPAGASYDKVQAAIERYETYTEAYYTASTWALAKNKYDAAVTASKTAYTKEQQATLDAFADELNAALDALIEADANYTALNTAVTALSRNLTTYSKYYTDDYKTSANALIAEANDADFLALKAKDQATVDAKTEAIQNLIDNPEFLPWDYTKINEAKAAYEAIDRDLYTDDSLAVVDELFANIVWTYVQDPVKRGDATTSEYMLARKQEIAVLAWEASLETKPVAESADYDELDAAIAAAEAVIAKGTANYTDESVKVLKDAIEAGKNVSRDLTVDDQAIVDAATAVIKGAMTLTEKDADYTALNAAIEAAKAKNADEYTDSSYSAMAAKLAAAEAVAKDLKVSSQSVVDKAANELNAAIAALQNKPTETTGSITSVDWTPSTSATNTYTLKINYVDGNYAAKVQFIDIDGNTRTFTRRSDAVKVTSYKADGTQCNELDREAAYDVWEVNTKLAVGTEVKVIAKYDYTWESLDNAYVFTVNLVDPELDTTVYSVTNAESGAKGRIDVTIVTGADIQGVRTVMSSGATLTTKTYTLDESGHKVFNAKASCYAAGVNTCKVQVKYGNEWHDTDLQVTYTVK